MDETRLDHYKILGIAPDAGAAVVRQAFLEKARYLVLAFEILTDATRRRQYDEALGFLKQKKMRPLAERPPASTQSTMMDGAIDVSEVKMLLEKLVVTLDGRVMQPAEKVNRRLMSRLKVEKQVFIVPAGQDGFMTSLVDVSGNGARIASKEKLNVGDSVTVSVSADEPSFALAKVVREGTHGEYGLKWIQVFEASLPRGFLSDGKV